jgi:hypothetical protein
MEQRCVATNGIFRCELAAGHSCRHREKNNTWLNRDVVVSRSNPCPSVCGTAKCSLQQGHAYKHRGNGETWTDAGAERTNREKESLAA